MKVIKMYAAKKEKVIKMCHFNLENDFENL